MQQAVRDALIGFIAAQAQAQAEVAKEAQRAGIAHAWARKGRYLGRKPSYTRKQFSTARDLLGQETTIADAQDWMRDDQLNALWAEITRTAKPGARVVFRTAAEPSLLPGRVEDAILDCWTYEAEQSRVLGAEDRSSIYGGFHLYVRKS